MGRGGKRRELPPSPLHPSSGASVGFKGRSVNIMLVKVPVRVEVKEPADLVEATTAALHALGREEAPS